MSEPHAAWVVTHDGSVWNLRKFELPIRVGRSEDADLIVKKDTVSRIHALIDWHDGAHHVSDNKSENHTWVDGIMLIADQDAPLSDGSEIIIGTAKLRDFRDGVTAANFARSVES
jgi:pSer/pThr/pTyr-binding forkhead associated (FHA) protein